MCHHRMFAFYIYKLRDNNNSQYILLNTKMVSCLYYAYDYVWLVSMYIVSQYVEVAAAGCTRSKASKDVEMLEWNGLT